MSATEQGVNLRRHLPNPLRVRISCPDCGWVSEMDGEKDKVNKDQTAFDCPRCGAHYSHEDFWAEHEQKVQAMHHNHAQADLTNEETE